MNFYVFTVLLAIEYIFWFSKQLNYISLHFVFIGLRFGARIRRLDKRITKDQ